MFEISTRPGDGGRNSLVLRWAPYRPTVVSEAAGNRPERILVADLATFRLRYFGRRKPDGERTWFDAWDSASDMPELLELVLAAHDGGNTGATSTIIELLARDVP
jgi:hypothetical protein